MPNLVPLTNPYTGETYRVHPWLVAHGVWLPPDDGTPESKSALRAMLPGIEAFEHELARIIRQSHLTAASAAALVKAGVNDH